MDKERFCECGDVHDDAPLIARSVGLSESDVEALEIAILEDQLEGWCGWCGRKIKEVVGVA